jgi:TRAP transporter TAXI family solute receptor
VTRNRIIFLLSVACLVLFAAVTGWLIYDRNRVHRLTIATAAEWGEYSKFGKALARVVERNEPRVRITVRETSGSLENLRLLQDREVDFAIAQNNTLYDRAERAPSVRAVALLFPEVFHCLAAADRDIRTLSDLKGKKIALMPGGSGSFHLFVQIMKQYGFAEGDFTFVHLRPGEAAEMLRQGEVDAVSHTLALGNEVVRDLLKTTGARLLPVDDVDAMKIWIPYLEPYVIPSGTYRLDPPVPGRDLPAASVKATLLTHADTPEDIVLDIAKILHQNRAELVAEYPYAARMKDPLSEGACISMHPGAIDFYNRNEPPFLVKHAELLALLLTVAILVGSGILRLHMYVKDQEKERADKYNLDILALVEKVHAAEDREALEAIRQSLLGIFRELVEDLDRDRISMDFFPAFTFSWNIALRAVQHRETLLVERPDPP